MNNKNSAKTYLKAHENSISVRMDFLLALIPSILWSVIRYKTEALVLIFVSVGTTVITEFILNSILNRKISVPSVYTVYCGVFYALTLYSSTSLLIAASGAVLIPLLKKMLSAKGKCLYFVPLVVREVVFLMLPNQINTPEGMPYESIVKGIIPNESPLELILGMPDGVLGSLSVIAVVIGGIYIVLRKSTEFKVSLAYISTTILLTFIFPLIEARGAESSLYELLSSEALFITFFVLTDMPSTPEKKIEKYLKGILCAVITFTLTRTDLTINAFFMAIVISETIMPIFNVGINQLISAKERKNAE